MPYSSAFTRRQTIVGAAATMVSARLFGIQPPQVETGASSDNKKNPLKKLLHVTHPGSKTFDSLLAENFPGLMSIPGFHLIQPHILIVENNTENRITALNATWTLNSPTGRISQHSYAYFFRPVRLSNVSKSGRFSVLGPNRICVVSPFFCWTPKRFKKVNGPTAVTSLLQKYPIRNLFATDNGSAVSVTGRLNSAIEAGEYLVGSHKSWLGKRYVATRNAARDEAQLILTYLASTPGKTIKGALLEHMSTPIAVDASRKERIYYQGRMRFGRLVLNAVRLTDEGSVQTILEDVARTPPLVLTRRSA